MGLLENAITEMDMLNAGERCILSMEATLTTIKFTVPGVTWAECYITAKARAHEPGEDRQDGRVVAYLEGLALASKIARNSCPAQP